MDLKIDRLTKIFSVMLSISTLVGTVIPLQIADASSALLTSETGSAMAQAGSKSMLKVGSLSELKGDKTCNGTGGILVYAETESYRIYICADRKDRTQARYYRSRERNGKGKLDLEAKGYNPHQMRYFEFKNNGYAYLLQMPMSQIPAPELTVVSPRGNSLRQEKVTRYLARP